MRPRTELLVATAGLIIGAALAVALGRSRRPAEWDDPRLSTFLAGPQGGRALAEALERLGVEVRRWRRRPAALYAEPAPAGRQALAVLGPEAPLERVAWRDLVRWVVDEVGGDLVLAGEAARPAMRCFGWRPMLTRPRPRPVHPPGRPPSDGRAADASWYLEPARTGNEASTDTTEADDGFRLCDVPAVAAAETLLVSDRGDLAALRVSLVGSDRTVVLVADQELFRNRTLRDTEVGPVVLGFLAGYGRVTFEEAGHGFDAGGSLGGALLAWSRRSPWGWAAWQLAAVGVLALALGAVRFGPARPAILRRRRSPLEHVGALAGALTAARGHDTAIAALIRGLRRRLQPTLPVGGDPRPWLAELERRAPAGPAREAAGRLLTLTAPGQPASAVYRAAHAVEDLWQELR